MTFLLDSRWIFEKLHVNLMWELKGQVIQSFIHLFIYLFIYSFHHSSVLHLRTCRGVTEHQGANQLVTVKSSQQILDCFVIVVSE